MSKQAINWSPEEIAKLKELAGTMSSVQIGRILGRSKDAVKNKITTLDLPRYTTVVREQLGSLPKKDRKKEPPQPIVPEVKPPLIALYKNHNPVRRFVTSEIVSRLEWCQDCGSPVSNWVDHRSRLNCKR